MTLLTFKSIFSENRRLVAFLHKRFVMSSRQLPLYPLYLCDRYHTKGRDWTVNRFSARFRSIYKVRLLCRHINKKPRASSLRDSKHKRGVFMSSDIKIKVQSFGRFLATW